MPKGRRNQNLPDSGIPGLLWRKRGAEGGVWVVSVNIPKEKQSLILNKNNKPLTRVEVSTGEASLKKAIEKYAAIKVQVDESINSAVTNARAGSRRAIDSDFKKIAGAAYAAIADKEVDLSGYPEILSGIDSIIEKVSVEEKDELIESIRKLLVGKVGEAVGNILEGEGKSIAFDETEKISAGMSAAINEALAFVKTEAKQGFLAKETELGINLRQVSKEKPGLNLSDLIEKKLEEKTYSSSGKEGYYFAVKAWKTIIKSEDPKSITTANIDSFLSVLTQKGWNKKPLGVESANNMTLKIIALLKKYKILTSCQESIPIFKLREIDKMEKKLKRDSRSTNKSDVKLLLDYLYNEKDIEKLKWALMVDNSTMRTLEVMSLKWEDLIEIEGNYFFDIRISKTVEGVRYAPLNARLRKYILPSRGSPKEYIVNNSWQQNKQKKTGPYIFLKDLQKSGKISFSKYFTPHDFRRGAGGDLGFNVTEHVRLKMMGHSGGMSHGYTRNDLLELCKSADFVGTPWAPNEDIESTLLS